MEQKMSAQFCYKSGDLFSVILNKFRSFWHWTNNRRLSTNCCCRRDMPNSTKVTNSRRSSVHGSSWKVRLKTKNWPFGNMMTMKMISIDQCLNLLITLLLYLQNQNIKQHLLLFTSTTSLFFTYVSKFIKLSKPPFTKNILLKDLR